MPAMGVIVPPTSTTDVEVSTHANLISSGKRIFENNTVIFFLFEACSDISFVF